MIIVSVAFVICWFPSSIYFVLVDITAQTSGEQFVGYHATVFLTYLYICTPTRNLYWLGSHDEVYRSYLYICMNPFIYAVKHEGVKEKLARLLTRCKRSHVIAVGDTSGGGSVGSRNNTRQPRTGTSACQ